MHIPKKYGQSKVDLCPFCKKQATAKNKQSLPVCQNHKKEILDGMKCICGSTLDMLNGKFGIFFSCMKCGSMNLKKVLEFNAVTPKMKNEHFSQSNEKMQSRKETTVRSDDPRYFE